ncbi:MAG: hypothetical protein WDW38_009920 [Sanguina aurantia]
MFCEPHPACPAAFNVAQADIRKSRFIAQAAAVTSPGAALAFVHEASDGDATHNGWAYRLGQDYRFNDDGEPGGTAGRPILQAIEGQAMDGVVVVVTRWYGGIKLGAGGLVRLPKRRRVERPPALRICTARSSMRNDSPGRACATARAVDRCTQPAALRAEGLGCAPSVHERYDQRHSRSATPRRRTAAPLPRQPTARGARLLSASTSAHGNSGPGSSLRDTLLVGSSLAGMHAVSSCSWPAIVRRLGSCCCRCCRSQTSAASARYFAAWRLHAGAPVGVTPPRYFCITLLSERALASLRDKLYAHLIRLDVGFFEKSRVGELTSRLSADTEVVQALIGSGVSVALRSVVMLLGAAAAMVWTAPSLAGLTALVIPGVMLPIMIFGKRVQKLSRASQDRLADAAAIAMRNVAALHVMDVAIAGSTTPKRSGWQTQGWRMIATMDARGHSACAGAVGRRAARAAGHDAAPPLLLGRASGSSPSGAGSVAGLAEVWGDVLRAAGAMERIGELLAERADIIGPATPTPLPAPVRGAIRFEAVTFYYPTRPDTAALLDFSLDIRPGETVALVGPSGAGKSTVLSMLLRFYDPQSGHICIDGIDIDARDAGLQDDAARRAGCDGCTGPDEFIRALDQGYAAEMGERGVRLSGGQRQRIAIARAILRDASLLLLDEATSALDAQSEAAIQQALERLEKGRTTVVIAHRLATVKRAASSTSLDGGRSSRRARPGVDTDEPDIRINLRLRRDRATVSLDLAGTPLHRRGWREVQGEAPLKENLAAAMLMRARWPEVFSAGGALMDPMCGSGTLLIEGALMAADVAPGLRREYFGFLGWHQHDIALWRGLLDEANARAEKGLRDLPSVFFGSDADPRMIQTSKRNAQEAGVSGFLTLDRQDVAHAAPPPGITHGLVITNPPYGERLGERNEMPQLYRAVGDALRARFTGWRAAVLAGDAELGKAMQLHADKRYTLYNGALETLLLTFDLSQKDEAPRELKPLSAGAQMLKNRLEKNLKHLRKRLTREGIHCWRAYDQDLPEYAAAIDVYGDTRGNDHLHIQEYRAPADIPPDIARLRLREIARVAAEVLGVARDRVTLKTRERGRGPKAAHLHSKTSHPSLHHPKHATSTNDGHKLDTQTAATAAWEVPLKGATGNCLRPMISMSSICAVLSTGPARAAHSGTLISLTDFMKPSVCLVRSTSPSFGLMVQMHSAWVLLSSWGCARGGKVRR